MMRITRTWLSLVGAASLFLGCVMEDADPGVDDETEQTTPASTALAADEDDEQRSLWDKPIEPSMPTLPPCTLVEGKRCFPDFDTMWCDLGPSEPDECICSSGHWHCGAFPH